MRLKWDELYLRDSVNQIVLNHGSYLSPACDNNHEHMLPDGHEANDPVARNSKTAHVVIGALRPQSDFALLLFNAEHLVLQVHALVVLG